jgi:signal transduction histidine kinase
VTKNLPVAYRVAENAAATPLSFLVRYGWAVLGVAAATGIYLLLQPYLVKGHDPSLLFLPVVIACAVRLGFGPAIFASVLSFCVWDFFFVPPRFTFLVAAPEDFVALGVFLLTGITTAELAAQVRRKADESDARGREIATLFRIGQIVSSEFDPERVFVTLAGQIAAACGADRCLIFQQDEGGALRPVGAVGASPPAAVAALAQQVIRGMDSNVFGAADSGERYDPRSGEAFVTLHIHEERVGVLYVSGRRDGVARMPGERNLIVALANYTAAVIARQNLAADARHKMQSAAVLEERNRLTREIHDTVAQGLTGLVIQLQAAVGAGETEQTEIIDRARDLAQECLAEARRSVRALRPGALEGRDLPTALRDLVDRTGQAASVQTALKIEGAVVPLPALIEANFLRIAQEGLTNALRHARAGHIVITLHYDPEAVAVRIEDDGIGLPETPLAETGFGMTSMRERAAQVGAGLELGRSQIGGGRVSVRAPLPPTNGSSPHLPEERTETYAGSD